MQLYYTLVQPYFVYCNIVWASNYPTRIQNLNILHRKAIRTISRTHQRYYIHSADLFRQTGILTLSQINLMQASEFMYKYANNLLPQIFPNQFSQTSCVNPYNARSLGNHRPIFCLTNIRQFSIRYMGAITWNSIPISILSMKTFYGFRKKYRECLTYSNWIS